MAILKTNLNDIQKPDLNDIQKTDLNNEYKLIQPWSVPILRTKLPKSVYDALYEISENILRNPDSESYGDKLAGQIETEKSINTALLESYDISKYFKNILTQFILECKAQMMPDAIEKVKKNTYDVKLQSMWIVSQKSGEYNPVHHHTNCQISGVMYLKLPSMLPSPKRDHNDGSINFLNDGSRDLELSNPYYQPCIQIGELYIFGSQQKHAVYPFRSSELTAERRSISFNASFNDMPENYDITKI